MRRVTYTTQAQIRAAFWAAHPDASRKLVTMGTEKVYTTDTRCAFVAFVDALERGGEITEELAQRVTLEQQARKPSAFKLLHIIQTKAHPRYGWEDVSEYEDTQEGRRECRKDLEEYRTAQPQCAHRRIQRRVKREG